MDTTKTTDDHARKPGIPAAAQWCGYTDKSREFFAMRHVIWTVRDPFSEIAIYLFDDYSVAQEFYEDYDHKVARMLMDEYLLQQMQFSHFGKLQDMLANRWRPLWRRQDKIKAQEAYVTKMVKMLQIIRNQSLIGHVYGN